MGGRELMQPPPGMSIIRSDNIFAQQNMPADYYQQQQAQIMMQNISLNPTTNTTQNAQQQQNQPENLHPGLIIIIFI